MLIYSLLIVMLHENADRPKSFLHTYNSKMTSKTVYIASHATPGVYVKRLIFLTGSLFHIYKIFFLAHFNHIYIPNNL